LFCIFRSETSRNCCLSRSSRDLAPYTSIAKFPLVCRVLGRPTPRWLAPTASVEVDSPSNLPAPALETL